METYHSNMARHRVLTLLMVSLAPVPMATWGNHEQSHVGQNYLRSLFALGFQGFLILICVAIYAVLLQNVAMAVSLWRKWNSLFCRKPWRKRLSP